MSQDLTGRRILLAEDNMLNQEIARGIIGRPGRAYGRGFQRPGLCGII